MNEEELRKIIKNAVQETLIGLGFSADHPSDLQADMLYLRRLRRGSESIVGYVVKSIIGFFVPVAFTLLFISIKEKLGGR